MIFKVVKCRLDMELFKTDEILRQKALKLYNRTEDSYEKDVETVKKWLTTQKHLPELMEDEKIRNFLIINKCSIEKTKQKIDMYYTIRSLIPDLFAKINPNSSYLKDYASITNICIHPKLVHGMYKLFFFKMKKASKCLALAGAAIAFDIMEVRLKEDFMFNHIIVFDVEGSSYVDALSFTPSAIKKIYALFGAVYSLRVYQIHVINSASYVYEVIPLVKAIIKDKVFQKIHVHKDSEILKTFFAPDDLPKDYGGDGPSLQELTDCIQNKLYEYRERFDELDKLRVDERLRPKPLDNDDVLGFYGNFKNLDID